MLTSKHPIYESKEQNFLQSAAVLLKPNIQRKKKKGEERIWNDRGAQRIRKRHPLPAILRILTCCEEYREGGSWAVPFPSYTWPFMLSPTVCFCYCGRKQPLLRQVPENRTRGKELIPRNQESQESLFISIIIMYLHFHQDKTQNEHTMKLSKYITQSVIITGTFFSQRNCFLGEFLSAGQKPCPVKACCRS